MTGVAIAEGRRVRVAGALDKSRLQLLTREISEGDVVLDLSEVTEADASAVSQLARLSPGQCGFVGCPHWLARRVERRAIELANGIR